jgi:hypothetical protein
MSETVFTGDAPSMKYTVPATLVVTTAALGNLLLSINVAANDTDGTKTAVVGVVVGIVIATLVVVAAERTRIGVAPALHEPVTGQRNKPIFPSAHNNDTLSTGTKRNGAVQPDDGATDTFRVPTCGSNDEAFQHNNGAGCDADQD